MARLFGKQSGRADDAQGNRGLRAIGRANRGNFGVTLAGLLQSMTVYGSVNEKQWPKALAASLGDTELHRISSLNMDGISSGHGN
jgi:hypothetical protein